MSVCEGYAQIAPNAVRSLLKNKLGYVRYIMGEVIHFLHSIPRFVKNRQVR